MRIMEGKVCVITGGAGSIGRESARLLIKEGARVMLVDNNEESLKETVADLGRLESDVIYSVADVSDTLETRGYIDEAVEKLGDIDVIFSNAGISGVIRPITEFPEDVFDRVMAVNVRATFLACKYGIPRMRDGGSIIITIHC